MSNDDLLLNAALRGMAEEDGRTGASDAVAARLRAEFRHASATQRRARFTRYGVILAAAAALVAAITVPVWRSRSARLSAERSVSADRSNLQAREIVTDFMPLTYSDVPFAGGQIVRLEVPRTALASFGLTPPEAASAAESSDTVLADVVVGDDGLARAVRFVRSGPD